MEEFELIAKTFQGLEEVLAKELTELGANNIQIGKRMVAFTGNKEMMYRANLALRTALRILKPLKRFHAANPDEVYEAVKAVEWEEIMDVNTSFAVDAVVYSNEFRHSQFVAYRVKDAIVDYFREKKGDRPNVKISNPDLYVHIHIAEESCTLSLDSSGESLHRRGYRQEAVEAPLNEVLAAGMILMTGWRGECDFIDPMCGSGTLPIEAALIARNIAPGIFRKEFAFERWPDFDRELLETIYNDDSQEREFEHHIYGYDIKQQAYAIATRNVKAAGVSRDVTLEVKDFATFTQPAEQSIIVMNPPYGERISSDNLLELYATIGERLKHEFKGCEAWVLSFREECFIKIGLKPSVRIPLYNGALECEFRKYELFEGKYHSFRAAGEELDRSERPHEWRSLDRRNRNKSVEKRTWTRPEEEEREKSVVDQVTDNEEISELEARYARMAMRRKIFGSPESVKMRSSRRSEEEEERDERPHSRGHKPYDRKRDASGRDRRSSDRDRKPYDRDRRPGKDKPYGKGRPGSGKSFGDKPFTRRPKKDK